ncbi:serine hydrolase domain-containing protein [Brevundimonas lutea]|uniref:serine hydrolase domain-containing protein n=1 Tax=Brevundimonas lutea TaxID=2293980 RepID=UPI000F021075|nr:serine hydrolase domain-containing protein [Brevundimonas lutea]
MRRRDILAGLSLSALAGAACGREPSPPRPGMAGALDRARAAADAPAMGAIVVDRDGVVWSDVAGVRRRGGDAMVTLGDRWHLGSNTKAMTALTYARLVEAGGAAWDTPLAQLFPVISVDPAWAGMTLEPFMAHRAGLLDAGHLDGWFATARADPRSLTEQRLALIDRALSAPPNGTPGQYAYGNLNYMLVGAAIEQITGRPAETAIAEQVFQPLGLLSAGWGAPPDPAPWGHRNLFGQLIPMDPASPGADNPLALGPAGTAHMSLADYGGWLRVFLGGGPQGFVSEGSLARLARPWPDAASTYALGWGVAPRAPWAGAGPGLAHEGSNTMWRCAALVAPARGLAAAVIANRDTDDCAPLAARLIEMAAQA